MVMNNIDLGSAFDNDITATADLIKSLITNNASYTEVEQAQVRLRELIAAKRSYLYSPKDPSYFIDQMFSAATPEDRRKRAAELDGQVLEILVNLSKEEPSTQEQEIPAYDLLLDVLAFLRFFKSRGVGDELSPANASQPSDNEESRLVWGNKPGLTIHRFCEALTTSKFIGFEDAQLLEAVLEDYKSTIGKQSLIDWEGTNSSITTFFIACQYLGILNPETAPSRSRVLLDDCFGQYKLPVPPAADIINRCFTVRGATISNSTISRDLAGAIILELDTLRDRVERFYVDFQLGDRAPENLTWDDILYSLFALLDDPAMDRKELVAAINLVDFQVLKFLNHLLAECGPDRHEASIRITNLH